MGFAVLIANERDINFLIENSFRHIIIDDFYAVVCNKHLQISQMVIISCDSKIYELISTISSYSFLSMCLCCIVGRVGVEKGRGREGARGGVGVRGWAQMLCGR